MKRSREWPPRIGMPGYLYLNAFADVVGDFFGATPYHVGSSAAHKDGESFRDVDVRIMLDDDRYAAEGYEHIGGAPLGTKWAAICLAFSALGEKMTGLPIDFQVQSVTIGNSQAGPRWALGGRFEPRRSVRDRRTPVNDVDIIPPAQEGETPHRPACPDCGGMNPSCEYRRLAQEGETP